MLDQLEDEAARRFRGALSRLALLVGEAAVVAVLPAQLGSTHSALDARVMLALVIGLIAAFVVVAVRLTYPSYAAYRRGGGQLARVYTELVVVGMVATVLISAAAWRRG